MGERYFHPWIGRNYNSTRTLLMSESAYDWLNDEGDVESPSHEHPENSIRWNAENLGRNSFFTQVNRALCNKYDPSSGEMHAAWNDLAYTIFVQGSVGRGAGVRPTIAQWRDAGPHFLDLLENLKPRKVIVTGKEMWDMMPECSLRLLNEIQAYRLTDNMLVWCIALPHPSNRTQGFRWQAIGESVRLFRATEFPTTCP